SSLQVLLAAFLAGIDHRLRDGVTIDDHVWTIAASIFGSTRLLALNPSLVDVEVHYQGEPFPLLPVVIDALARANTEPWLGVRAPGPEDANPAPPLGT